MNIFHRILRFVFRPRELYDLGPEAYAGRIDGQQVMLMFRDNRWHYYINAKPCGHDFTARGAELQATHEIRTYFVRGSA